jgi:hypothetical protein
MKYLITGLIILLLFISCKKKQENDTSFFMTAKMNGVLHDFSDSASAYLVRGRYNSGISVGGISPTVGHADAMHWTFNAEPGITTGVYTDTTTYMALFYADSQREYYAGYETVRLTRILQGNHMMVTITEITDTNVRGTFNGDLYAGLNATSPAIFLTEGKFNLPLTIYNQ